jgi:hypothetical protein
MDIYPPCLWMDPQLRTIPLLDLIVNKTDIAIHNRFSHGQAEHSQYTLYVQCTPAQAQTQRHGYPRVMTLH